MPVGGKQWLLNVFDVWIIQEIRSKSLNETSLCLFFLMIIYIA